LQENIDKITAEEEKLICLISDLYINKIFSISSGDEFIKTNINNNITLNNKFLYN